MHFDSIFELIEKGAKEDAHPVGTQVFIWLWTRIFGISEFSLRFPFFVMGILCIPLMYQLTKKWFNATAALFTSGYIAVSQYAIFYSLIARPYSAGLFFILLYLIIWTKMIFEQDYRWWNVVLFGLLAAICAYIHQFCMLTALLIAIVGLFYLKKSTYLKYLLACLIAIVLYAPHIPIVLYQINLGATCAHDSWISIPKPRFTLYYVEYLFHFSRIAAISTAIALIISSKINHGNRNFNKKKIGIALLLFFIPFIIGYLFSLFVFPVLQYSSLFFAFPFLLLAGVSFIDPVLDGKKIAALILIGVTMTFSLAVNRQHYKFLSLQWYDKSVSKTLEKREIYGSENVDCLLNISPRFMIYFEKKYETCFNNALHFNSASDDFSFLSLLQQLQGNYLVVAGLTDLQLEIVKQFYPILVEYIPCFTSEIYVFAKTGIGIEGMEKINLEEYVWETPISAEYEFIPLKECNLSEICPSRFTKILLTLDYICHDSTADYALVLQTSYKGHIADWRCVKPSDFSIQNGDTSRIFLPFRYELLVKDSKRIKHYDVKIFLWNISKTNEIIPLRCVISTYKSNPFIYAMGESVR